MGVLEARRHGADVGEVDHERGVGAGVADVGLLPDGNIRRRNALGHKFRRGGLR